MWRIGNGEYILSNIAYSGWKLIIYEYDVCGFIKKIKTTDAAEHCVSNR